jgi:hypothetical protein
MKTEYIILIITFLIILICILIDRYYQLKQYNYYLKRKYHLLLKIRLNEKIIDKRQYYLNRYNFQRYNLNESLLVQEYPDYEKNTYF